MRASSEDLDQAPHDAASDLSLHCLPTAHIYDLMLNNIWF